MTPDRVGALVNPHAGSGDTARLVAELADCLPAAAMEARITAGPADVPEAVREQGEWADLLVSVGGDGTLRVVAETLADADFDVPLFVVPAGRGNSTYRHLYGDVDWREIARGLAAGIDVRPLEVGRVEAEPGIDPAVFVLGFTAGLFRTALESADRLGALPGSLAYVLATAYAAAADDPLEVSVDVGGEPFFEGPARLVAVGGGRYRGRSFELWPASRPGDRTLHVLAVEPAGITGSVSLARLARSGRIREHPAARYATGETATVRADGGLPIELDGTPVATPVETARVSVVPGAVEVAYPPGG